MLRQLIIRSFLVIFFCLSSIVLAAKEKNQAPPVFVETVTIKLAPKSDQIAATGNLVSIPGIIVKPEIAGRITKVFFKSGDTVEKNAPLIEINPDIIKSEFIAAQSEFKVKKLDFERSFALYKTHDISKSEFDQTQANYNSAQARVEGMRSKLQQTTIVAPFAGRLGLSQVSEGDYINVGQNIVSLQTVDPLKVDFSVPEAYQSKVAVGQTVLLRTDAYPQTVFSGQVEAIESLINPNNRTLGVRANVPNKDGKLIPGGFVAVTLQFSQQELISIPQTAIVYAPDGCYVFKVVANKAEKAKVVLGAKDSDNVIVKSGLQLGDVVIIAGQIKLYPGASVVISGDKKIG